MYPHRIRLRGPWNFEPLARSPSTAETTVCAVDAPLPPPRRVTMPCSWGEIGLGDFAGRVRYLRSFGWVGRDAPEERVWLTFAGADRLAEVWVNGQLLGRHEGAADPFEFEVTSLLARRNELKVEVEGAGNHGGLWGEVALEVRCSAFLRAVRWWTDCTADPAEVHVAGELVGVAERPLELYVLVDGSTAIYATLEARPAGRSFHATGALPLTPADTMASRQIRIELVNVSVVWYAIEGVLEFGQSSIGR